MYNRVTSDSNSDAVFASCTILPIHQTTLNVEEMEGIDGLGSVTDAIDAAVDYVSDVVDSVGDCVSDFVDSLYFYPQDAEPIYLPDPTVIPPSPRDTTTITNYIYSCDKTIADLVSGATCPCMPPPW
ncbi:MAG: hypothetical protein F4Y39_07575 [Gemmatimonadetes bacterium]|nr:hypothetical protein [Gemmatimonadota bacterium]MYF74045.1 hypothetical protein [Gemmatimonadota bacterium]MYK50191.1 hypothetical protein [Gemmatimonadota bacterium]